MTSEEQEELIEYLISNAVDIDADIIDVVTKNFWGLLA